ncbi:MAG: hypothetical protein Q9219_002339 [cf. Caloplaca sp. 3 TL-2023]
MSPPTSPLKSRDINTSLPSPTKTATKPPSIDSSDEKPKSMEYHRQILQSRLEEDKGKHTYVSPSDMIMSPATKKLEALKGKRFGKAKGQSLFADTMRKDVAAARDEKGNGEGEGKEGEK